MSGGSVVCEAVMVGGEGCGWHLRMSIVHPTYVLILIRGIPSHARHFPINQLVILEPVLFLSHHYELTDENVQGSNPLELFTVAHIISALARESLCSLAPGSF